MKDPIARFLAYRSDTPRPIPLISWILLSFLIAGVPMYIMFKFDIDIDDLTWISSFIFLFLTILITYCGVWILTYYHYRRFLTTKKGLNFFTSKWFRYEQLIIYGWSFFIIAGQIFSETFVPGVLVGAPLIALIWIYILYFIDFITLRRYYRHKSEFADVVYGGPSGVYPIEMYENRMRWTNH